MEGITEKLAGVRRRKKFRIRMYSPALYDDRAFIEIKSKDGQAVSKQRACVHPNALSALLCSRSADPDCGGQPPSPDLDAFLYHVHRHDLTPRVLIKYHREAFVYRLHPGLRITWDRQIQCVAAEGRLHPVEYRPLYPVLEGGVVLEVKTEIGLPSWIWRSCARVGADLQAVSKYVAAAETLKERGWRPAPYPAGTIPVKESPILRYHATKEYA